MDQKLYLDLKISHFNALIFYDIQSPLNSKHISIFRHLLLVRIQISATVIPLVHNFYLFV